MENSIQQKEVFILMGIGIFVMLLLAIAFILFFTFSQRKLQSEQLNAKEAELQHQQQLLFSTIRTQEAERKRIAKDLHDDIGSKLNVIFLHMNRIGRAAKELPPVKEMVSQINDIVSQTIDTTRRISHDLLPPTLDNFGLAEAVNELCENYQKSEFVNIVLQVKQNDGRLGDKLAELNVFRIIQELISNSIKHGQAEQISILLWLSGEKIQLEYRDNGKGFDLSDFENRKGLGMKNIESRVKMIGGKMNIYSEVGEGILVKILMNK